MKLIIHNFQSIAEAEIDLDGFVVIGGDSNKGKSSFRRAIDCVLYNEWEAGFLKVGTEQCLIRLELDGTDFIQLTKPDNTYTVSVGGVVKEYPKVGKRTLDELFDLKLNYFIDEEGNGHNVHVRRQIDPWYYVTSSRQEQSRIIASIFNFDNIKSVLKQTYVDKGEYKRKLEDSLHGVDELKLSINNYEIRKTSLQKLVELMSSVSTYKEYLSKVSELSRCEQSKDSLLTDIQNIDLVYSKYTNLMDIVAYNKVSKDFRYIKERRTEVSSKIERTTTEETHLNTLIGKITELKVCNEFKSYKSKAKSYRRQVEELELDLESNKSLIFRYSELILAIEYKTISKSLSELMSSESIGNLATINNSISLYQKLILPIRYRALLKRSQKMNSEGSMCSDRLIGVKGDIKALQEELDTLQVLSCPSCGEDISDICKKEHNE